MSYSIVSVFVSPRQQPVPYCKCICVFHVSLYFQDQTSYFKMGRPHTNDLEKEERVQQCDPVSRRQPSRKCRNKSHFGRRKSASTLPTLPIPSEENDSGMASTEAQEPSSSVAVLAANEEDKLTVSTEAQQVWYDFYPMYFHLFKNSWSLKSR